MRLGFKNVAAVQIESAGDRTKAAASLQKPKAVGVEGFVHSQTDSPKVIHLYTCPLP